MEQRRKPFSRLLSLHTGSRNTSPTTKTPVQKPPQPSAKPALAAKPELSSGPHNPVDVTEPLGKKRKSTIKQKKAIAQSLEEPPQNAGKHAGPTELTLTRRAPPPLWKVHKRPPAGHVARDPRFDDMSGHLDMAAFSKNYKFLANMRDKERRTLQNALSKAANSEERTKIKLAIQRIDNQEIAKKKAMEERRMKKMEKEALISSLKEGKRPYIKKKSEQKLELLCEKFNTLKKEKRLDKYLERKEKKNRAKELFE